jgi:citrate synthase
MSETTLTTSIATSDAASITVRGYDLVDELIGRYTYTEILYFLICNRFPTGGETRILDACLVTLMEHGFTPSSLVARLVIDSVPDETQVAMAAGLTAVGSVFVGTMEGCARLLDEGIRNHSGDLEAYCRRTAAEHKAKRQRVPGFGHPVHRPDDPRPPRLFQVAAEAGAKGDYIGLVKLLGAAVDEVHGRHLTINATGAIAALLLEIAIPVDIMRGIAVVSRAGGLTGHIMEEKQRRSARHIWRLAEEGIAFDNPRAE